MGDLCVFQFDLMLLCALFYFALITDKKYLYTEFIDCKL